MRGNETVSELAERACELCGAELTKLKQAAATRPLTESETRRLRDIANALRYASIANPKAGNARRAWLRGLPEMPATESDDE
jgi:hypothetical protein